MSVNYIKITIKTGVVPRTYYIKDSVFLDHPGVRVGELLRLACFVLEGNTIIKTRIAVESLLDQFTGVS